MRRMSAYGSPVAEVASRALLGGNDPGTGARGLTQVKRKAGHGLAKAALTVPHRLILLLGASYRSGRVVEKPPSPSRSGSVKKRCDVRREHETDTDALSLYALLMAKMCRRGWCHTAMPSHSGSTAQTMSPSSKSLTIKSSECGRASSRCRGIGEPQDKRLS